MISNKELATIGRKARKNLINFRHIFLTNSTKDEYKAADYQHSWSDILLNSDRNYAIEGFRESGKSQYVLRAFPLYALVFPDESRDFILILKSNSTEAEAKLKELEREYDSNPALRHNLVRIVEKTASNFEVIVHDEKGKEHNIRICARGKGAAIRGMSNVDRRPKIIIADDLQDLKDVKGDTIWETDWQWFLSDVYFLGRNARIFLIGNNLGEKCILEQAINNADNLMFETMRIAQLDDNDNPAWASRDTTEEVLAEKERFRNIGKLEEWLREKMCIAVGDETRVFLASDFRYYSEGQRKHIVQESSLFLLSDLASSTKSKADYRVLMLIAVDDDDRWYILECRYGRWQTTEYLDHMFSMVREHRLIHVYAEDGQILQTMDSVIRLKKQQENTFFEVIPLKPSGRQKEYRIQALQPRFKASMVWFLQDADYLKELESELLGFTMEGAKTLHDDLMDTLAYGLDVCRKPHRKPKSSQSVISLNRDGCML